MRSFFTHTPLLLVPLTVVLIEICMHHVHNQESRIEKHSVQKTEGRCWRIEKESWQERKCFRAAPRDDWLHMWACHSMSCYERIEWARKGGERMRTEGGRNYSKTRDEGERGEERRGEKKEKWGVERWLEKGGKAEEACTKDEGTSAEGRRNE